MEVFDNHIIRKIHKAADTQTFVCLIKTSKRFYNCCKHLTPIKRKQSLKLISVTEKNHNKQYYVLPNGRKEGLYKEYNKHNVLYVKCYYVNGILNGSYEEFDRYGFIREKCTYIDGKREGTCERFHDYSVLRSRCHYVNGILEGPYEIYDYHGNLGHIDNFINGIKKVPFDDFYTDGSTYVFTRRS